MTSHSHTGYPTPSAPALTVAVEMRPVVRVSEVPARLVEDVLRNALGLGVLLLPVVVLIGLLLGG